MNRTIAVLSAASLLALSSAGFAEQELTATQMDAVTAGGNAAADAFADAFGVDTTANTSTFAEVLSLGNAAGQVGQIEIIQSTALADSDAAADGVSAAMAMAAGVTEGTLLSDTVSTSEALADAPGLVSRGMASQQSIASEIVRGRTAYSSSAANAMATLAD